jgi:carboxyl-terminal processing protease
MNRSNFRRIPFCAGIALALTVVALTTAAPAQVTGTERDMAESMLEMTRDTIKRHYFDPKFRGIDVDGIFASAKEQLKRARSRDELMLVIAGAAASLSDSHTNFFPPSRSANIEYGWRVGIVGDDCYVTAIEPGSSTESSGLKVGDKVLAVDGFRIERGNITQLYHRYFALAPAARVRFTVLRPGEQTPRTIDVPTRIVKTANLVNWGDVWVKILRKGWDVPEKERFAEFGNDLIVWKMPSFAVPELRVDDVMGKVRKFNSLILDLRGNNGGYVDTQKRLVEHLFDKEVKIGTEKYRKEVKERIVKGRGGAFKGRLIVLVDHDSASASEVIARVVQLEKRGTVIGDRTAGAVMASRFYDLNVGVGSGAYFGVTVSVYDLVMSDGRSLERTGVTPDETRLPTGADLAARRDPVLAYAAAKFGIEITPEKAGSYFPFDWSKN